MQIIMALGQLADWAQELNRRDIYRKAAENMVRLDPHQPVPRGYLADALLDNQSGRAEAKQHLRTAIEFSPEYAYGSMRLFELHFEDKEIAEAEQVLSLTGQHLPPGYLSAFRTQLLAVKDVEQSTLGNSANDFLLSWLDEDIPDNTPLARVLDGLDSRLAFSLITHSSSELRLKQQRKQRSSPP